MGQFSSGKAARMKVLIIKIVSLMILVPVLCKNFLIETSDNLKSTEKQTFDFGEDYQVIHSGSVYQLFNPNQDSGECLRWTHGAWMEINKSATFCYDRRQSVCHSYEGVQVINQAWCTGCDGQPIRTVSLNWRARTCVTHDDFNLHHI